MYLFVGVHTFKRVVYGFLNVFYVFRNVIWNNVVSSLCMCLLLLNNIEGELVWFSVFITALYSMMSVLLVYLYSLRLKGVSLSNAK